MSKLDALIQKLCPHGVEYFYLGELEDAKKITLGRGKVISKKDITDNPGSYPVYSSSAVGDGEIGRYGKFMFEDVRLSWSVDGGGKFFYRDAPRYSITNVSGWLKVNDDTSVNIKYLYYALLNEWSKKFFDYTHKAHPSVVRKEYRIPLPPLSVQQEIVRILDSFTELTAELNKKLEEELAARRKQYEHYRDELLTFDVLGGTRRAEWRTLGEIATVTKLAGFEFTKYVTYSSNGEIIALRGLNVKNGKLNLNDVKYIDNSDLSKLARSKLKKGDMLFTYVGTIGEVAIVDEDDKYYLAPNVALIRCNKEVLLPEYMRYYFQSSQFWDTQICRLLQASSMKNIPMEKIRKFQLCVPPMSVQQRIVNVLDNFDAICSDLNIGLPAEIAARQKQYEYYRDKLLTFKEL